MVILLTALAVFGATPARFPDRAPLTSTAGGYETRGAQLDEARTLAAALPADVSSVWRCSDSGARARTISFTLDKAHAATAHERENGVLEWRDAWPDTDVIAFAGDDFLHLAWQLHSSRAPQQFRWNTTLPPGGAWRAQSGGAIFSAQGHRDALSVRPPLAFDGAGNPVGVELRVEGDRLVFALTSTPASYPVLIDPLVELVRWSPVDAGTPPPQRDLHAMTFDETRGTAVMFGGFATPPGDRANDLWELTKAGWKQLSPAPPLPAKRMCLHALAWDEARGGAVLFGGLGGADAGILADTWEWDGATWRERLLPSSPPPRGDFAIAYDRARKVTVLFGGLDPAGARLGDTWEYDGTRWVERLLPASPPPRRQHALAFDGARQVMVLFGGHGLPPDGGGPGELVLGDTWEYDGVTWRERTSQPSPPPRFWSGLAYDSRRKVSVLFGGFSTMPLGDTWEWDGASWLDRTGASALSPAARDSHQLVYDPGLGRVLLFAGDDGPGSLNDTWAYTVLRADGSPCARSVLCESGFCSDGVCCATACGGDCEACSIDAGAATDGVCGLLQPGIAEAHVCRAEAPCGPVACSASSAECPAAPDVRACTEGKYPVGCGCSGSGGELLGVLLLVLKRKKGTGYI